MPTQAALIEAAQDLVDRLNKEWEDKAKQAFEDALKTGGEVTWSNAPNLTRAAGSVLGEELKDAELRKAEEQLARLKREQSADKVSYAGLPSLIEGIKTCAEDQRAHLKTNAPVAPANTAPTASIPQMRRIAGTWSADCLNTGVTLKGNFEVDIPQIEVYPHTISGKISGGSGALPLSGAALDPSSFQAQTPQPVSGGPDTQFVVSGKLVDGKLEGNVVGQIGEHRGCSGKLSP
jgi:hypothetical protein